jgi:hypothetical protein
MLDTRLRILIYPPLLVLPAFLSPFHSPHYAWCYLFAFHIHAHPSGCHLPSLIDHCISIIICLSYRIFMNQKGIILVTYSASFRVKSRTRSALEVPHPVLLLHISPLYYMIELCYYMHPTPSSLSELAASSSITWSRNDSPGRWCDARRVTHYFCFLFIFSLPNSPLK